VSVHYTKSEPGMGTDTMGRVTVTAKVENLGDLVLVERGLLPADQVRSIEINDALVDTGATILSLPKRMIQDLGLTLVRARTALSSAGTITVSVFGTARLTIQGRYCPTDVSELPDECPVLVGQIPLESLDFVVDMRGGRLIGNPAHGGEQMLEMY
jgi:predicted aspartyl protease